MTKPIVKIVNAETGEEIEREMNAVEIAQWEADQLAAAKEAEAKAATMAKKNALFEKLGITEAEAKLLLS